ncbi:MAG: hypothetical protein JWQ10_2883 [Herbaspirillum sp.]|jgi:hypothetical protein|nr:hypothetical protein [Herbaspirillum sp.]
MQTLTLPEYRSADYEHRSIVDVFPNQYKIIKNLPSADFTTKRLHAADRFNLFSIAYSANPVQPEQQGNTRASGPLPIETGSGFSIALLKRAAQYFNYKKGFKQCISRFQGVAYSRQS